MRDKFFGDFIVKAQELGAETAFFQVFMAMFDSLEQFRCGSVFERYSINEIAIGVKHNKQIFVAQGGGYWITARDVSSNEVLKFFVQLGVDYFNDNMTCSAGR